ncbi:MAG TPA: cytochrome c-type biogenesis protein CcmH [Solirubrobacterales bacterium]|jgi:cytochrome c-type biogenesis protein CcmH/NrfF|nr:cytochrome c-type biogenesis protein CcmH [Solirubrobacterales bacterium]
MRRALALTSLVLAAATLAGAGVAPTLAAPAEPRASLTDIEDEVMCPICGTPLNLAAAPQAERERAFIRRLIANGETKEEIKDALVREYGPEVLATPESGGFDLAAWLVPAGGLLLAVLALILGVRRWRGRGSDRQPPAEGDELDAADSERLRSDLARYDL